MRADNVSNRKPWLWSYKKIRTGNRILTAAAVLTLIVIPGLKLWKAACEPDAHRQPSCARKDISPVLEKEDWSQQDYLILSEQTGLSGIVLEELQAQGRKQELFKLQEQYFEPVQVRCEPNSILSTEEYLVDEKGRAVKGMPIVSVEDGDILITGCSHVFGWRNGHAAIVVDAGKRLVLEAQVLGSPSVITSLDHWESYPSYMVLRLAGEDKETRARIASYARENLKGIPYRLGAGIWYADREIPSGTHCSHLVWYAYHHFGYDLDSDGGLIVTPRDLAQSKHLMVIQSYGI